LGKIYQALEKSRENTREAEDQATDSAQTVDGEVLQNREKSGITAELSHSHSVNNNDSADANTDVDAAANENGANATSPAAAADDDDDDGVNGDGASTLVDVDEGHGDTDSGIPSASMPHSENMQIDSSIITHHKPHSFEAEQFRRLKTTILFPDKGLPPRTIMVTSTAPDEGKSFVAANLAVSLANSIDEYVLLMDCDLRRPSIHAKFGFSDNTPGLTEYLTKKLSLSDILLKTVVDKLTIISCGRPPDNPSELISSDQMRHLITEVKARYDDRYIILDSPPPYITAEANALARQVDAIVIVVRSGKTKREDLRDLVDTYGKKKILGIVKNFDQPAPFSKKRNYSYGYSDG